MFVECLWYVSVISSIPISSQFYRSFKFIDYGNWKKKEKERCWRLIIFQVISLVCFSYNTSRAWQRSYRRLWETASKITLKEFADKGKTMEKDKSFLSSVALIHLCLNDIENIIKNLNQSNYFFVFVPSKRGKKAGSVPGQK